MDMTAPDAGQGRLRVSQIVYCCDLTDTSSPLIPLGVIADIRVGAVYGLGLKARKALSTLERDMIGGLARQMVSQPFGMLLPIFDALWDSSDPEAGFCNLPLGHPGSLRFEASSTKPLHVPDLLSMRAKRAPDILKQWAEDKLTGGCDTGFWRLLEAHLPEDSAAAERTVKDRLVA